MLMKQGLYNTDMKQLLVLYPNVFSKISKNTILLYNSSNGKKLLNKSKFVSSFLKNHKHKIFNFFYLPSRILNDDLSFFVNEVSDDLFGFVLNLKSKEPVQFSPSETIHFLDIGKKNTLESNLDIKNINEISVFCDKNSLNYKYYFESSNICSLAKITRENIDIHCLLYFLLPLLELKCLLKINFYIDSFIYNGLHEIIEFIREVDEKVHFNYFVKYETILNNYSTILKLLLDTNSSSTVLLTSTVTLNEFEHLNNLISSSHLGKIDFQCIIENINDYNFFNKIKNKDISFVYKPFYNGKNLNFFKQYIFMSEDDILNLKPNKSFSIKNQYINPLKYGKLNIIPNGDIYSDFYHKKVGNYNKENSHSIIKKEISKGNSWLNIRRLVEPCSNCVFEIICTPISNYEHTLKQYNLCNINSNYEKL